MCVCVYMYTIHRRQCMVPDVIVYNYPSSDSPRRAGRNCSTAPAIFEMKTFTACPTRYNFAQTKAVESRATGIKSEYVRKVKRIDQVFAPHVTVRWRSRPIPECLQYFLQRRCHPARHRSVRRNERRLSRGAKSLCSHGGSSG